MSQPRYFYWDEAAEKAQGPAKLPVIAVLYKQGNITGHTFICKEGAEEWFPLENLPEYGMLNEIAPEGAVVMMPEEAQAKRSAESREGMIKYAEKGALIALGIFAACLVSALIGFLQPGALWVAVIVLSGISAVGWALIVISAFDDGMMWVGICLVIPFGDIYYSLQHIDKLLWPLVIKYAAGFMAGAFVVGAVVGEAMTHLSESGGL